MKKQIGLSLAAGLSVFAFAMPAFAATISTPMSIGARGADVTTLQQTFAADSSIYPEGLVTGYFGSLSQSAVQRFQAKYGVVSSGSPSTTGYGRVGPQTIAKFNEVYGGTTTGGADASAPIITSLGIASSTSSSPVSLSWTTNESATGIVFYSTSPLVLAEAAGPRQAPIITGTNVQNVTSGANTSNTVLLNNLTSGSTYYYVIQSIDTAGNVTLTWPSTFVR